MEKTLVFRISKDGRKTKMTMLDFVGEECITKSKPFTDKLGVVDSDVMTPDYYATETVQQEGTVEMD